MPAAPGFDVASDSGSLRWWMSRSTSSMPGYTVASNTPSVMYFAR